MTTKADSKRRVVLPKAKPGEIYDVQELAEGQYLLVRRERPEPKAPPPSRRDCHRAMDEHPLRVAMSLPPGCPAPTPEGPVLGSPVSAHPGLRRGRCTGREAAVPS